MVSRFDSVLRITMRKNFHVPSRLPPALPYHPRVANTLLALVFAAIVLSGLFETFAPTFLARL